MCKCEENNCISEAAILFYNVTKLLKEVYVLLIFRSTNNSQRFKLTLLFSPGNLLKTINYFSGEEYRLSFIPIVCLKNR